MFRFFSGGGAQAAASAAGTTSKDTGGGNKEHAGEERTEEAKAVTSHIQKMDNIIRWGGLWYGHTCSSCSGAA